MTGSYRKPPKYASIDDFLLRQSPASILEGTELRRLAAKCGLTVSETRMCLKFAGFEQTQNERGMRVWRRSPAKIEPTEPKSTKKEKAVLAGPAQCGYEARVPPKLLKISGDLLLAAGLASVSQVELLAGERQIVIKEA